MSRAQTLQISRSTPWTFSLHRALDTRTKIFDNVKSCKSTKDTRWISPLLDYYSCCIIDVMSISPGNNPPWKTIHLTCAMSTLADLIVLAKQKAFAKMSLFYALFFCQLISYGLGRQAVKQRVTILAKNRALTNTMRRYICGQFWQRVYQNGRGESTRRYWRSNLAKSSFLVC